MSQIYCISTTWLSVLNTVRKSRCNWHDVYNCPQEWYKI